MHFKSFPLSEIPKNQRTAALRMLIKQWCPYSSAGTCVVINDDTAMVWMWDKERTTADIAQAGLQGTRTKVIPETLLVPQLNSGLRLIATLEGVEGQLWKSNTLAASRWWPAAPGADEWLAFQRDVGIAEHVELQPGAQSSPLLFEPWARIVSLDDYRALDTIVERLIYATVGVILAAATFWYCSHLIKLNTAISAKTAELAELNTRAQPVIAARNDAQYALLRVQALLDLDPYPDQLQLMAKVAEILPKNGTLIKEWDFHGNSLKLTIAVPDSATQSSFFVDALQKAGPFNNVRAATGGDNKTLVFNMDVNPRQETRR
jgi:hypothetical protein